MWYLFLLHVTYSTAIGEWVLVTAAAGGVGIAAVQLVKGRF
jgi:NADPH:quinone reductase-like Zn-dependent oxidoreductase